MEVNESNFLNFKDLLISNVFGNVFLFMLVGAIVLFYFCLKNRVPFGVVVLIEISWFLICMAGTGFGESTVLILIALALGLIVGYIIYKKIEGR